MPLPRGTGLLSILRVAGVILALTLLARAASLVREMVVAARLGTGAELDAFLIASVLPVFAISAFGAAIGPAFMPLLVGAKGAGDGAEGTAAFRGTLSWALRRSLLAGLAAGLALLATAPLLVPVLGPALPEPMRGLAAGLGMVIAVTVPVQAVVQVWTVALQAHDRYAVAAFTPALTPLATVAALEILGGTLGVASLAVGLVAGAVLEVLALSVTLARAGLLVGPRSHPHEPPSAALSRGLWLYLGAAVATGTLPVVDQLMAGATGAGGVATFFFASRLTSLIASLGTLAIGQAVLPTFSRHVVEGNGAALRSLYLGVAVLVFMGSGAVAVGTALLSEPLIGLLFQRGEFTADSAEAVAAAQAFYVLQVPFYLVWLVSTKVLSALGHVRTVLAVATLVAVLNVIGNAVLMGPLAVPGVGLATALAFAGSMVVTVALTLRALGIAPAAPAVQPARQQQ